MGYLFRCENSTFWGKLGFQLFSVRFPEYLRNRGLSDGSLGFLWPSRSDELAQLFVAGHLGEEVDEGVEVSRLLELELLVLLEEGFSLGGELGYLALGGVGAHGGGDVGRPVGEKEFDVGLRARNILNLQQGYEVRYSVV